MFYMYFIYLRFFLSNCNTVREGKGRGNELLLRMRHFCVYYMNLRDRALLTDFFCEAIKVSLETILKEAHVQVGNCKKYSYAIIQLLE